MKIVQLTQGSAQWHAHRARHFNASDAPAMMGCSPYKTRAQLLREVHTGLTGEVDAQTQRIFDNGHRFEALARPLAEEIVGDDLYPCVGVEGQYSASFDGLTLGGETALEHKTLSAGLLDTFEHAGPGITGADLPKHYRVQMEHQCMVSGAERVLFMATKWADDDTLIDSRHCWYTPDADLRLDIIAGWEQFAADLAAYTPPALAEPAKAAPMESLPAVAVRLDGALTVADNLPTFAEALKAFIGKIPAKPATDDEFATVDAACKALKKAEEALDQAEAGALASITDVEAMRRAVADCRKLARDTRLAAEKLVDRRKTEMREQAVAAARRALDQHIAALQAELAPMRLQPVPADFAGAIKGLRSIASMQDALDTTLANAKIAADQQARVIRGNVAAFNAATGDDRALQALFADLGQLVHEAPDVFVLRVQARIDGHRQAEAAKEAARQAAEAARIAAAEQRAREQAQREAEARIAEQQRVERERQERVQREALQASEGVEVLTLPAVAGNAAPAPSVRTIVPPPAAPQWTVTAAAPAANEPATLKLGTICERLGFTVSAAFLANVLHIRAADTAGRAVLYRESQWPVICQQLQSHISAMGELYTPEKAA